MVPIAPSASPVVPDYGRPAPRRRLPRWLTWGFGGVAGFGLLVMILLPNLCRSSETANRAKCASNLHQIGLAIQLYRQDHGGIFPASFAEIANVEQIGTEVFVCPASNDEKSAGATMQAVAADLDAGVGGHHCSYVYLGRGLTDRTVKDTTVVCYEPPENHDGDGSNVLYGDGHVDWQVKPRGATAWSPATTRPAE